MGLTRKLLSASTLGAVDFRSDEERTARSARRTDKAVREQNRLLAAQAASKTTTAAPMLPPAGWMPDQDQPHMLRWWDGQRWTEHTTPAT